MPRLPQCPGVLRPNPVVKLLAPAGQVSNLPARQQHLQPGRYRGAEARRR